jgi:hypothetical protein
MFVKARSSYSGRDGTEAMNLKTIALFCFVGCTGFSLCAATLMVTDLADSGPGTLRDQVAASAPGDTVQFATNGTIVLNSAITIGHTLFVQGPGPSKLTVSGNFADRVFVTSGDPVVLSGMTIRDGLVMGVNGVDGGLNQDGTAGGPAMGGAILSDFNSINLILSNCWITGNTAQGGQGGRGGTNNPFMGTAFPGKGGSGGPATGGALYSTGGVTVVNCTFSDNHAIGGQGGAGGDNTYATAITGGTGGLGGKGTAGAAEVFSSSATPNFTNCTFSGNSALGGTGGTGGNTAITFFGGTGGAGGAGDSGAMDSFTFNMVSCTVVSNSAIGGAGGAGGSGSPPGGSGATGAGAVGGIRAYLITCGGGVMMGNTILADNFASTTYSNMFMKMLDLGFNYFGDDEYMPCAGLSSRIGTVPAPLHAQLGPLAQNGSGLPTHAPLPGSPVIDWGYSFGTTTDERGAPRPVGSPAIAGGDGSDIGAFEFGSTPLGGGKGGVGGHQFLLTWPAYYGDFTLQSTPNLAPGSWMNVTDTPVVIGNLFVVTNDPNGDSRFYRLISH